GITAGCTGTAYCPGENVPRSQMAIFIAKGMAGGGGNVPVSGTVGASPYNCVSGGVSLFSDVLPTDSFCKHVHYIASKNVTSGCSAGKYCPNDSLSRLEMASFIAKAVVAPGGGAAIPQTYGPDPTTGLSYSCEAGSPSVHFTDVPATDAFCKHVHYLWAKGIVAGCSGTTYCPAGTVSRDQMAKFLVNAFTLPLYGP
ncbi:MAG TPA: S-layer homology domain-containing protein, partial [Thermoanaerobaculia bacterium]|nr:S-layer homology domain-containing protein [Thermoanaerobaculia bacterium]